MAPERAMLTVRRELVWDHEIPPDPERDDGFVAFYVGRVLDRGTAEDVRALGLERIRRHLDAAPARREVIEFWRWWLGVVGSGHGHPDAGAATVPPHRRDGGAAPK